MSRRKAEFTDLPQSREEAVAQANDYAMLAAEIGTIEAERAQRIAEVNADIDERIAPRQAQLDGMFKRLKGWWEAHGEAELKKGRKSTFFGGCEIGTRTATPSLKLPKGQTAKSVVDWMLGLRRSGLSKFIRTKRELDKDALIAALKDGKTAKLPTDLGFALSQPERFFVEPVMAADDENVEVKP
ncbi:MAG: host-nuclease inhibitor Gam family protein [Sphingorhabdus sp.]